MDTSSIDLILSRFKALYYIKCFMTTKSIQEKQGRQRFLKWKIKNNSRTFHEHINTFQEHKRGWKYYNNWFEGFFKKA